MALEYQVGADQTAARLEQPSQQPAGDGIGRVGDDSEATLRQVEIGRVSLDDGHVVTRELPPQRRGPVTMQLHCDDASAGSDEGARHRARSGTVVENEVARAHERLGDEAISPGGVELVPPPPA